MSKAKITPALPDDSAEPVDQAIDTVEIPEQTDFSSAVRGPGGVALLMRLTRLRQALRTIRDLPIEPDPRQAALAMQEAARLALSS